MVQIEFENNGDKFVRMGYEKACSEYTLGFSMACFVYSSLSFLISFIGMRYNVDFTILSLFAIWLFLAGIVIYVISKIAPVAFYEMLEGVPKP